MFKYLACFAMILMNGATALAADAADEFAEVALKPFWRATQLRESMFFIQAKATERPQSSLLFAPKKIITVTSATREVVFEAGKDYVVDLATGVIRLPQGSRIAFKTLDEMYPLMTSNSPKIGRQGGDKTRGIFFDNADVYHKLQVEVTYELEAGQWKGEVPAYAGESLPNTMKKLRAGEPIKLVLCGDSISAGYNASKYTKAKPGCPAYGELVALAMEKKFGGKVTFENHAVGGWSAGRGLQHATEKKLGEGKPDVVIIAFGMNDVFQRNGAAYQKNIRSIMEVIRKDSPATEFILVGSMLGNAEWGMPMEQFPLYLKVLKELTGPGVVLADMTTLWGDLLKRKSFYDLCGNGVNHPNDFGHQIYAQVVMALLTPAAAKEDADVNPLTDPAVFRTILCRQGDEKVHTYRIPGLATSPKGTLLAVFDMRHTSAADLPGDIDVGLMRSTDDGRTWSKTQVILDFDKNEKDSRGNGVGDPTILIDRKTGDILVVALWSKGNRAWHGSGPGLEPEETGQFVLTRSKDDGVTWSKPVNISKNITGRDPSWRLLFNGPGSGIQLRDGTLVIPAQFRDAKGAPHSCFFFSGDGGESWTISQPAIASTPHTSEAQIAELADGSLLLSMRNESQAGRRVWAKYTWKEGLLKGSWSEPWLTVPDPTCMASLIRHPSGTLLFSNPNSASKRIALTIRTSSDDGATWSGGRLIDPRGSMYSCMTVLNDGNIGVLYEGVDEKNRLTLHFAKFPLDWVNAAK